MPYDQLFSIFNNQQQVFVFKVPHYPRKDELFYVFYAEWHL